MSKALAKAMARSRSVADMAHRQAMNLKSVDLSQAMLPLDGGFGLLQNVAKTQRRLNQFRGWLYAAVNVLAAEAAGQPVCIGKLKKPVSERTVGPRSTKSHLLARMTESARRKSVNANVELVTEGDLIDLLERPNPVQNRWQFVYSFVANLNLTGWAYVVHDTEGGRSNYYSLPSTWVRPSHKKGPFSEFYIVNPNKPEDAGKQKPLDRSQVSFAYLPDPSNPLSAMAPSASQDLAVQIDEKIQSSQVNFFDQGVMPSVVITIGRDPHPSVPASAGTRPRLTQTQRRQVTGAIQKVMGGVANYGNPAIIDGLIERIDRLSMGQNEMGWDKSEIRARTRILSAFAVHPYLLGEHMPGSMAQAAVIEKRFYKRVNTFLDMLGTVVTGLLNDNRDTDTAELVVWWEKCIAEDPSLRAKMIEKGRLNNDITRDEFRAELGFAPAEDAEAKKSKLLETVGGMDGAVKIFNALGQGALTSASAIQLFMRFFDLTEEEARLLVGGSEEGGEEEEAEVVELAREELVRALAALRRDFGLDQKLKMLEAVS